MFVLTGSSPICCGGKDCCISGSRVTTDQLTHIPPPKKRYPDVDIDCLLLRHGNKMLILLLYGIVTL